MHTRTPRTSSHAASLVLILLVCVFLFPPIVLKVLQDYDNSVYGLVVRDMLHGGMLYRDVFDHKLPGWYLLVGGVFRLLGDSPIALNLMYLGFLVAGAWAIYGVAVRAGARVWLAAAWACLFALWPDKLDNHLQYFGSMSVHFTNAGAVIASLEALAVWAVLRRTITSRAAAGILMAMACLIKPQSALLALLLPLWVLFAGGGRDRAHQRTVTLTYYAAFVLPCVAVLAWLRVSGIWPYFLEAMRYNKGYVAATPLTGGLAFISGAIREGPDILLISAGAAAAIWLARMLRERTHEAAFTLVCIWFLCGLIETVAGKRYFIHTRMVLFAPAAVLAAIAWTALQEAAESCRPNVRRSLIAGSLAALLLIAAVTRLDIRFQRTLSLWAHSLRGQSYLVEAPIGSYSSAKILAGRWLWEHTQPDDSVEVIGPAAPPVLYEAGRPPAGRAPGTRFTFPFPLEGTYGGAGVSQPRETTERFWTQWLQDMRRNRPAYLADSWGILERAAVDGSDPLIPKAALAFVRHNYRLVTRIYGLDMFERTDLSLRPEPSNPWTMPLAGPVLTAEQGGARDFFVLAVASGTERWAAWYSAPDRRCIMQASSADGMAWTPRRTPALTPQGDEIAVNRPCVVRNDSGFRMWFTAETRTGSAIQSAISSDGVRWRRAAISGLERGGYGRGTAVAVMFEPDTGVYRMWYPDGDTVSRRGWYVESRDGVTWQAPEDVRFPHRWDQACFVRQSGWIYAFCSAGRGGHRIYVARARKPDGPWEEFPRNPILTPEPESWMDDEVSAPCVVRKGNGWLLYFTGRGYRDVSYQVGVARCQQSEFWP